jgi:hypothetical protein
MMFCGHAPALAVISLAAAGTLAILGTTGCSSASGSGIHSGVAVPARADYVDVAIDARGMGWNREHLIFERTNEQRGRLPLRRLRGLALTGGAEAHCGRLGISGFALQFVPLSVHRVHGAEAGVSPPGGATSAGKENHRLGGVPGGGRVVTLSARWRWR